MEPEVLIYPEVKLELEDEEETDEHFMESENCEIKLEFNENSQDPLDCASNALPESQINRSPKSTKTQRFSCDSCDKSFTRKYLLKKHIACSHAGKHDHKCELCSRTFQMKQHLKQHLYTHGSDRKFTCKSCGKQFKGSTTLLSHEKTHTKPFKCTQCEAAFSRRDRLDQHMTKFHNGETPQLQFQCDVCGKQFARRDLYMRHKAVHTEKRPFVCGICNRAFHYKNAAELHKLSHDDSKQECVFCHGFYNSVKGLKAHMVKVHGDEVHKCEVCGDWFTKIEEFDKHKLKHLQPVDEMNTTAIVGLDLEEHSEVELIKCESVL